ncbi:hypothetical protein Lfu02_21670 [Longispora fulva]|uniref:WXG100 family type VII secretion target n=1 Tax=Longispora fulva TaxID=619741 RepID=A0A8J7KN31_9ACTN|nr:hypothetical protein [Longispora fulva]MBG6139821.1 hypothetical protein [Longispora fulva]GIG57795.1 hypothetical protein Lfu02_21670 [Longispora fulva]
MSEMIGADPTQLENLGQQMRTSAGRLDSIRSEVGLALGHSHWDGPDADQFRGQWAYQLSGLLHTAALATAEAGKVLVGNAHQQIDASADSGGSAEGRHAAGRNEEHAEGESEDLVEKILGVAQGLMLAARGIDLAPLIPNAIDTLRKLPGALRDGTLLRDALKGGELVGAARVAERLNPAMLVVGAGIDGFDFGYNLAKDPDSAATWKAGADIAFDIAEAATLEFPPLAVGIGIVHFGYDIAEMVHPGIAKAVGHAYIDTAKSIGDVAVGAVETGLHGLESGFKSAGHFLGF